MAPQSQTVGGYSMGGSGMMQQDYGSKGGVAAGGDYLKRIESNNYAINAASTNYS